MLVILAGTLLLPNLKTQHLGASSYWLARSSWFASEQHQSGH